MFYLSKSWQGTANCTPVTYLIVIELFMLLWKVSLYTTPSIQEAWGWVCSNAGPTLKLQVTVENFFHSLFFLQMTYKQVYMIIFGNSWDLLILSFWVLNEIKNLRVLNTLPGKTESNYMKEEKYINRWTFDWQNIRQVL